MITLGKLNCELYWEWRCAAAELNLAKSNKIEQELKFLMMQKEIEIARLRAGMFTSTLDAFKGKVAIAQEEYDNTKKKLEDFIGVPMPDGCIINENLEVIKVEEEDTSKT